MCVCVRVTPPPPPLPQSKTPQTNTHPPAQLHPWFQQPEIVNYCTTHSILIEAYTPLVRNQKASNETLLTLARKHGKTPSQILVRWSLQRGFVPLPKSDDPERIVQNADVFAPGFALDDEDMRVLDALDEGEQGSVVQVVDNR